MSINEEAKKYYAQIHRSEDTLDMKRSKELMSEVLAKIKAGLLEPQTVENSLDNLLNS